MTKFLVLLLAAIIVAVVVLQQSTYTLLNEVNARSHMNLDEINQLIDENRPTNFDGRM